MIKHLISRNAILSFLAVTVAVTGIASCSIGQEYISGIKWPEPPIVKPGKTDAEPPSDAVVLFDGKDLSAWEGGDQWEVKDGVAIVQGGDITTKQSFGDCQVHIEWSSPVPAEGSGQGRGNSGVFLMDRYELQVLDSYENQTYFDGQASSIYKQQPPMVNVTRPPGEWNSYDIIWTAPKFKDDGSLESPAYITVLHNGVLTLNHFELEGITPFTEVPHYTQHGNGPIRLQNHGNPVRFRNIWVRELRPLKGVKEREPFFRDGNGKEWPVHDTAAVSGGIKLNGQPLTDAKIALHPIGGGNAIEGDIEDGKFQLNHVRAGRYTITFQPKDPDRDSKLAQQYGASDKSEITIEVAGKKDSSIELELTTK